MSLDIFKGDGTLKERNSKQALFNLKPTRSVLLREFTQVGVLQSFASRIMYAQQSIHSVIKSHSIALAYRIYLQHVYLCGIYLIFSNLATCLTVTFTYNTMYKLLIDRRNLDLVLTILCKLCKSKIPSW